MSYTALVLDDASKAKLMELLNPLISLWKDWKINCHHMTINLGDAASGPAADLVGQQFDMIIQSIATDDRVVAVGIESDCPSKNAIKHITVAVNVNGGGKAKHSNKLTNWTPLVKPLIVLRGTVEVVQ